MLKKTGTQAIAATSATAETELVATAGTVPGIVGTSATDGMPVRTGMFDKVMKPATKGAPITAWMPSMVSRNSWFSQIHEKIVKINNIM
jgi:hypothetical protein